MPDPDPQLDGARRRGFDERNGDFFDELEEVGKGTGVNAKAGRISSNATSTRHILPARPISSPPLPQLLLDQIPLLPRSHVQYC